MILLRVRSLLLTRRRAIAAQYIHSALNYVTHFLARGRPTGEGLAALRRPVRPGHAPSGVYGPQVTGMGIWTLLAGM